MPVAETAHSIDHIVRSLQPEVFSLLDLEGRKYALQHIKDPYDRDRVGLKQDEVAALKAHILEGSFLAGTLLEATVNDRLKVYAEALYIHEQRGGIVFAGHNADRLRYLRTLIHRYPNYVALLDAVLEELTQS